MTFYYYPLTTTEIEALKQGKLVQKHYSPELQPDKILFIFAWNKSKLDKLDKKTFHNMRKAGIDVANIPLTNENISEIESEDGGGYTVHFDGFNVLVLSEESLNKLKKYSKTPQPVRGRSWQ